MRIVESVRAKIAITIGAAVAAAGIATAAHAHAEPMCQFLGQNYPVWYPCDSNPLWLPYGTPGNAPSAGPPLGADCSQPWNQHNQGCL